MPARVIAEGFEAGPAGAGITIVNCPGLTSGVGIFTANPHSGSLAAILDDAFVGTGAGVIARTMPADGVANVGLFVKFIGSGGGPFSNFVRCTSRLLGGTPGDTRTVLATFTLDAADPLFPGQLYVRTNVEGTDHAAFLVTSNTWYELRLESTGDWSFRGPSGAILDSDTVGAIPTTGHEFNTAAGSLVTPGGIVVDDYYYQLADPTPGSLVPAVRQYPRDDALGLGSAPRIHPPPRRTRVVGGYQ